MHCVTVKCPVTWRHMVFANKVRFFFFTFSCTDATRLVRNQFDTNSFASKNAS